MRTSPIALDTTPDNVEVKACCAPMTSLLSRETRAPVWARVKKAIGWRSTCAKTWVRRSKMRLSPMREDRNPWPTASTALATAVNTSARCQP